MYRCKVYEIISSYYPQIAYGASRVFSSMLDTGHFCLSLFFFFFFFLINPARGTSVYCFMQGTSLEFIIFHFFILYFSTVSTLLFVTSFPLLILGIIYSSLSTFPK